MLEPIVLVIALLICSAFFSGSETAIFSLSRVQIHKLKESRSASAKKLVDALKRPRETIVTILLGNEFVNISISIVGASIISMIIKSTVQSEIVISVVTITPLVLIFGEILPKNLSFRHASQFAQVMIWPLRFFYHLVSPLRIVLSWLADGMVKLFGGKTDGSETMIMEDEYRKLVDLGGREGAIEDGERELIHNVFEFTDKVVSDIMTPAEKMFSLRIDLPYERMLDEIKITQFSRVPFYDGDSSNIIGILHVRDILPFHRKRQSGLNVDLRDELHPVLCVEPSAPLENLLKEFQKIGVHMAMVKDKEGAIRGLVTMGNVLQELFGEIEE